MKIQTSEARPSKRAPDNWFTGTAWIDEIAVNDEPSRARLTRVTLGPGARTAWHTHPLGQVIHVLSGSGLVQKDGGPIHAVHPGDTVTFAPNEKHWHGAAPENTMVHLAMQEADDKGVQVTWLEPVTDEQYRGK